MRTTKEPHPMKTFDFNILSDHAISTEFKNRNITDFQSAATFIKRIPYDRPSNTGEISAVLTENKGTCSTKNAALKVLANENNIEDISLHLGIYNMNCFNTPLVKDTLNKYGLEVIPEAHIYLRVNQHIIDCAVENALIHNFEYHLIHEIEIEADQAINFKKRYHQEFLKSWIAVQDQMPYTFEELWNIREECLKMISNSIN